MESSVRPSALRCGSLNSIQTRQAPGGEKTAPPQTSTRRARESNALAPTDTHLRDHLRLPCRIWPARRRGQRQRTGLPGRNGGTRAATGSRLHLKVRVVEAFKGAQVGDIVRIDVTDDCAPPPVAYSLHNWLWFVREGAARGCTRSHPVALAPGPPNPTAPTDLWQLRSRSSRQPPPGPHVDSSEAPAQETSKLEP